MSPRRQVVPASLSRLQVVISNLLSYNLSAEAVTRDKKKHCRISRKLSALLLFATGFTQHKTWQHYSRVCIFGIFTFISYQAHITYVTNLLSTTFRLQTTRCHNETSYITCYRYWRKEQFEWELAKRYIKATMHLQIAMYGFVHFRLGEGKARDLSVLLSRNQSIQYPFLKKSIPSSTKVDI